MKRSLLPAAGVIGLLLVSSCSNEPRASEASDPGGAQTVSASPTASEEVKSTAPDDPNLPSNDDLETFFSALSTSNVEALTEALPLAEAGSAAEAFAKYQVALQSALTDAGQSSEDGPDIEVTEDAYVACTDLDDDSSCVTWADVEGRDGKIVTFSVNGGPLSDRIATGPNEGSKAGGLATVKLLYAYQRASAPVLNVLIEATSNDKAVSVGLYESKYRNESGRQITADSASIVGATELGADSTTTMLLAFRQAELGGVVTVPVYGDDYMTTETVELATK